MAEPSQTLDPTRFIDAGWKSPVAKTPGKPGSKSRQDIASSALLHSTRNAPLQAVGAQHVEPATITTRPLSSLSRLLGQNLSGGAGPRLSVRKHRTRRELARCAKADTAPELHFPRPQAHPKLRSSAVIRLFPSFQFAARQRAVASICRRDRHSGSISDKR